MSGIEKTGHYGSDTVYQVSQDESVRRVHVFNGGDNLIPTGEATAIGIHEVGSEPYQPAKYEVILRPPEEDQERLERLMGRLVSLFVDYEQPER